MREPHAKCVKISRFTRAAYAISLGFCWKSGLAPSLLTRESNRVDSVDGSDKVRGLFAITKIETSKVYE
jgi:hypothetical protein